MKSAPGVKLPARKEKRRVWDGGGADPRRKKSKGQEKVAQKKRPGLKWGPWKWGSLGGYTSGGLLKRLGELEATPLRARMRPKRGGNNREAQWQGDPGPAA